MVQLELEGGQLKFCTSCLVDRSQVSMHCSVNLRLLSNIDCDFFELIISIVLNNALLAEMRPVCGQPGPPLPLRVQLRGPRQPPHVRALHSVRILRLRGLHGAVFICAAHSVLPSCQK